MNPHVQGDGDVLVPTARGETTVEYGWQING